MSPTPVDHWLIKHPQTGVTLIDVAAPDTESAYRAAIKHEHVNKVAQECGGLSMRRLLDTELQELHAEDLDPEPVITRHVVRFEYEGETYTAPVLVDLENDTIMDKLCRGLALDASKVNVLEIK